MLLAAGETKSRHSPRVMEAMKITTVVTRHTNRLSSTLSIGTSPLKTNKHKENDIHFYKYSLWLKQKRQPTSTILQSVPNEFGFWMDVLHAVLGEPFVDAVEHGAEQATHQPHQHEEGQVHRCP